MADFLFDSVFISPPDRGDVFGADATIALLDAAPDPAEATIGDLTGVLDTDTSTTWLASTGVLWAGSLATQPTLDAGGPTAVGYVVALGSGSTAVNVRWVEITPTTSTVQVTASALLTVAEGAAEGVVSTRTVTADASLAASDIGGVVEVDDAAPVTITVPAEATVAWPAGAIIEVWRADAAVEIAAAGSVDLLVPGEVTAVSSVDIEVQYGAVTLRYRGSDSWAVDGRVDTGS